MTMIPSEIMPMVQWKHLDLQEQTWHNSQPVAGDHQQSIPVMHGTRICMMRWRMMKIHLGKTHHTIAEVVQVAKCPVMMRK